jgi:hypothetical protein
MIMAISVKKAVLWRKEVSHEAGQLASVLAPLAQAGVNLRVVMGYTIHGDPAQAAIEVFPVTGKKAATAASQAGLAASSIPCLLVEGDDRLGLGADMARKIADTGVSISFVVAESLGRKFSAIFGFLSAADAATASKAIKAAGKPLKARKR